MSKQSKNLPRKITVVIVLAFLLLLIFSSATAQEPVNNQEMAQNTIARLNQWRMAEGLWPLKPNAMLTELAMGQVRYLLTLPTVPAGAAIHVGPRGEQPYVRARDAGWTTYGHPERVAVNEIAVYGTDLDYAINWWRRSQIHSDIIRNPGYREIGAAVVEDEDSFVFLVVLGSRPGVMPALFNPLDSALYLSNERYRWANGGTWLQDATRVGVYREDGTPLFPDWQPWSNRLELPPILDTSVIVVYSDAAGKLAMSPVNLTRDWALLPGSIPSADSAPIVAAAPTQAAASGQTSALPTTTVVPAQPGLPSVAATTPVPGALPTQLPIPTATLPPPTIAPAQGSAAELTLIYDRRSLTLVNTAAQAINLSGIDLVGTRHHLEAARWALVVPSVPLTEFPANNCLSVWSWNDPNVIPEPAGCTIRRAVITVSPESFFWAQGTFEVRVGNVAVATCQADAGRCTVDLP